MNATDLAKLEAEIFSLRRQLEQAKRNAVAAPDRNETLTKMMVSLRGLMRIIINNSEINIFSINPVF